MYIVSIHAPARGATCDRHEKLTLLLVSIHAPARGATSRLSLSSLRYVCFNPRTCKRCDNSIAMLFLSDIQFQSTHLQEVRPVLARKMVALFKFQSTHLQEVRQRLKMTSVLSVLFQSTHLQEVRHAQQKRFEWECLFQSTHLQEVRPFKYCVCVVGKIVSIHAPARGATILYRFNQTLAGVSIHAPARGATSPRNLMTKQLAMFQSTHLQEVRQHVPGSLDSMG